MSFIPSPTESVRAQAQPQIPPDLLNLLAQMKVKQATDAAARDMAAKMGQKPPTVAQQINGELEGNARQEIAQKLGLPGLMAQAQPQGQPQSQAPDMAPPEQPTQHMARGGLTKLKSNLPKEYAGGGIVAFSGEEDSVVPDPGTEAPLTMAELLDRIKRHAAGPGISDRLRASLTDPLREYLTTDAATRDAYRAQRETTEDVAAQQTAAPQAAPAPKAAPAVAKPQRELSARPPAAQNQGIAAVVPPVPAPVVESKQAKQDADLYSAIVGTATQDNEARARRAAELDEKQTGASREAAFAGQREGIAKLAALQEAAKANRPSKLIRGLQLMGKNQHALGLGGAFAGVSEGIDETNAGYSKEDIANQDKLNTLNQGMLEALAQNDVRKANLFRDSYKEEAQRQKDAQATGASIRNTNVNSQTQRDMNAANIASAEKIAAAHDATTIKAAQLRTEAMVDAAVARTAKSTIDQYGKNIAIQLQALKNEAATWKGREFEPEYKVQMARITLDMQQKAAALAEHNGQNVAPAGGAPAAGGTIPLTPEQEAKRKKILGG